MCLYLKLRRVMKYLPFFIDKNKLESLSALRDKWRKKNLLWRSKSIMKLLFCIWDPSTQALLFQKNKASGKGSTCNDLGQTKCSELPQSHFQNMFLNYQSSYIYHCLTSKFPRFFKNGLRIKIESSVLHLSKLASELACTTLANAVLILCTGFITKRWMSYLRNHQTPFAVHCPWSEFLALLWSDILPGIKRCSPKIL